MALGQDVVWWNTVIPPKQAITHTAMQSRRAYSVGHKSQLRWS